MVKLGLIVIALLLHSCAWIKANPDSLPEELIEEVIDKATGLDIDLTSTDGK